MAAVNPDVKAALVASGRWGDFVRAKSDLDLTGMEPAEARRRALEMVAPEIAEGMPKRRSRGRPRKEEKDAIVAACAPSANRVEPRVASAAPGDSAISSARPSVGEAERGAGVPSAAGRSCPSVSRADFDGRTCSMRDAVTWVLSNLCFDPGTVDRSQAPSALAVTYFDACVASPGFKADFLLKVGPMLLPKKFEEEKSGGDDFTGKAEYDLLGAIAGGGGAE